MSMWKKSGPVWVFIVVIAIACYSAFFTVDQTERALVLQLGKPVRKALEPGFHVKIPFLQRIVRLKSNLRDYDPAPVEMLTLDKKRLYIDNYLKWSIADPWVYYNAVKDEKAAQTLLGDVVQGEMKIELGRCNLMDAISTQKKTVMETVTKRTAAIAIKMGIEVVDVRIKSMRLGRDNQQAILDRMISERQRLAKKLLAEGGQEALVIRTNAERACKGILAEAHRESQAIKGKGDALAARIYAEGFSQESDFFSFIRTLEAYQRTFNERSTLFLSRDDDFMSLFKGN